MRCIANNAGAEGSIVVQKVKEGEDAFGYNARTEKYEDLIEAGVIDPTKVTRMALENAASVAALMLTTEAIISDKPSKGDDDDDDGPAGGGGMPGGMGGGMPGGMGGMGGMM
jgi:chaperonin GroEL